MPWQLTAIRATLKVLPKPLKLRLAAKLFLTPIRHAEPGRETAWRERGESCQIGGMAGTAFGDGAKTIWLMHGWEGRGLQLSAFIEPLVERGFRVVALDGPGHGRTPGLAGFVTFAHHLGLGMQDGEPHAIVGHSMGSVAAILAAQAHGFDGRIACLGGPPDTGKVMPRGMQLLGIPAKHYEEFLAIVKAPFGELADDRWLDPAARAAEWGGHLQAWLAEGDEDIPVEESRAIVEGAGGAVHVVTGVGHRSIMWHEPTVQAVVDFVASD